MSHTIVLGNEKGGSGKSTIAMHLLAWLARAGNRVVAIDLDLRQQSLLRHLENRIRYRGRSGISLVTPEIREIRASQARDRDEAEAEDRASVNDALAALDDECDFVVIDCPGASTALSAAAHQAADTLVTPLNDSFVDFDMLARVDGASGEVRDLSRYTEVVWAARKGRAQAGLPPLDWVVLRNRIASLEARNMRRIQQSLERLSARAGCRIVGGFSERVIFRELFPHGLTLLDLDESADVARHSLSHVAGRQELRDLIANLKLGGAGGAATPTTGGLA